MGKELYNNIPTKVGELLAEVRSGKIGLPDLQRPFVWKDSDVRNLLDSMIKGYPVGYIMLWSSPINYDNTGHIGKNDKTYQQPDDLVIDGQQRLTALLAAMYGIKIRDKNYKERNIKISYNPLTQEFAVWTQAYEKNIEWISSISEIFIAYENHEDYKYRKAYIKACNEARNKNGEPELNDEEEETVENNIHALLDLVIYLLPTLRINNSATEEDVAEIFVRVNSGGQKLTEKNFIETLLAVYDHDIHIKINDFCRESRIPANGTAYNQILEVDPSHLIRMSVGVGFKRARLKYAYMIMRGKNLQTGEITEDIREENLSTFRKTLDMVINLNNWHAFMNIISDAGYLNSKLVASSNAVVYSYVLYLIGKYEYKVNSVALQQLMKRWFFMATVTGFYTGSTETEVEKQFADLRDIKTDEEFILYVDKIIGTRFTDDYFVYTLTNDLNTSSAQSPAWFAYIAAVNVLGTPMLFSNTPLAQHFTIGTSGNKNAIDKHHIFPKHYLTEIGYDNDRDRNQIANYTYLDYATNVDISDAAPIEYVSRYREKLGEENYKIACEQNALPENFERMKYPEFLAQRRVLMAKIIKKAYKKLTN